MKMKADATYRGCGILPQKDVGMFYEKGSRFETVYCS